MKIQTFFYTSLRWLPAVLLFALFSCSDSTGPDPTPPSDTQEGLDLIDGKLEAFNGNADYTVNNYNVFATAHQDLLLDLLTNNQNVYKDIDQF